tara:strand:- start:544 stop:1809 length:1266 start_codon:yes stop_codon:yes gene_type:complete
MFVLGNAALNFYILFFFIFLFFFTKVILEIIKNNKKISIFVFISYLYFVSNAIFVAKNTGSIIFALGLIKFIVLFFFIKISFSNLQQKINKILVYWTFFFLFLEFDTLIQLFNGTNIIGLPAELMSSNVNCQDSIIFKIINSFYFDLKTCPSFLTTSRLSGFFGNELVIGSFVLYFYSNLYGAMLHLGKNKIANFFLIISFFVIVFSGERMAFLLFVLSLGLFVLFKFTFKKFLFYLLFIFLSYFLISNNPSSLKRYDEINQINSNFVENIKADLPYYSIWMLSAYNFKNNIPFGIGIKNFRNSCNTEVNKKFVESNFGTNACKNHSHNFYLEILAETGLVGFFVFSFIFLNFFFKILNIYFLNKNNYIALFSLISIISILIPFKTSGSIFSTFNGLLMFFLIFLSYYLSKFCTANKPNIL